MNELATQGAFLAPVITVEDAKLAYQQKKELADSILHEGVDYGVVPGSAKPALLKAGAEKMCSFFGLSPVFVEVETVEDWTGKDHSGEPFFYYHQKCKLFRGDRFVADADGSCNSWEKKYRYRWVSEFEIPAGIDKATLRTQGGKSSEFSFAIDKAETSGKYGKPASYWQSWKDAIASGKAVAIKRKTSKGSEMDAFEMDSTVYAVPNADPAEQVNTVLKMSQKRALVAAVLIATGMSEFFTQDIEDYVDAALVSEPKPEVKNMADAATQEGGVERVQGAVIKVGGDKDEKKYEFNDLEVVTAVSKALGIDRQETVKKLSILFAKGDRTTIANAIEKAKG